MTDLVRISASQVKTYRRCPRAWAFDKLDGVPRVATEAQAFGTAKHAEIENWLTKGTLPSRVVAQGIVPGFLPTPSPDLFVEHEFHRALPEIAPDAELFGYIDGISLSEQLVWDNKSTGSLQYAMDEDQLFDDPQAVIYAKVALEETGWDSVTCRWLYFEYNKKTEQPTGKRKVEVTFTKGNIAEGWAGVLATCDEIYRLKKAVPKALQVVPNLNECGAYGGCAYLDLCDITPAQRLVAHAVQFAKYSSTSFPTLYKPDSTTEVSMGLDFASLKKSGTAPAPAPVNGATPAVTPATPQESIAQRMARIAAQKGGVNPPEQHVQPAPTAPAPAPAQAVSPSPAPAQAVSPSPAPAQAVSPSPAPTKRGRPRKVVADAAAPVAGDATAEVVVDFLIAVRDLLNSHFPPP